MEIQYFYLVSLSFIGLCQSVSHVTSCIEHGRFPNDENHDCRGYIMCLIGGITNFTQYKLTCPQGSIYSHLEQQCTNSTNYKCYPNFNCTSVSNFINPESEDCSSYIACVQGMGEIATARLIKCPNNTLFNTTIGECVDQSQTTCYTSVVKPVIAHPTFDTGSIDNQVNVPNHKHNHSNNAVSNHIKVYSLLFICVLFIIV